MRAHHRAARQFLQDIQHRADYRFPLRRIRCPCQLVHQQQHPLTPLQTPQDTVETLHLRTERRQSPLLVLPVMYQYLHRIEQWHDRLGRRHQEPRLQQALRQSQTLEQDRLPTHVSPCQQARPGSQSHIYRLVTVLFRFQQRLDHGMEQTLVCQDTVRRSLRRLPRHVPILLPERFRTKDIRQNQIEFPCQTRFGYQ